MTKPEKRHLLAAYQPDRPRTLFEVMKPDQGPQDSPPPLTWQEVDRERLSVLDQLITKSLTMFPSSVPLQDMAYLMEALKAAQGEINRLQLLCQERGIVTSLPSVPLP